jgi:hypothetical protein
MTKLSDLHRNLMQDPEYRREYDGLEDEFALLVELVKARTRARLGWDEVARRMKVSPRTIKGLGNGHLPSMGMLGRFAKATGHRLKISFEPVKDKRRAK